ncbi:histidine phosphatase family protein [Patescibacteria group bacterium]
MAKIYLVRHAESIANTRGIYQGQTHDTVLSELGRKQAAKLASALESIEIDRIICSPLKRTFMTALECSKALKVPLETDTRILETNHGNWEGKSIDWVTKHYPVEQRLWSENPQDIKFPMGETLYDVQKRVRNFLLSQKWRENTLIITHDNIVRTILTIIEHSKLSKFWFHKIVPTGITEVTAVGSNGKRNFQIEKISDKRHLSNLSVNTVLHAL